MPSVPEEKIPFHFDSTFPAKSAKLEIPRFAVICTKKDLKPKFQVFFHSLELVEISGIEPLTS